MTTNAPGLTSSAATPGVPTGKRQAPSLPESNLAKLVAPDCYAFFTPPAVL